MTSFKTTVRADCAVSAYSPVPPSIKALAPFVSGGVSLWTGVHPPCPQVAGILNKANFTFHQPGFFIDF